MTPTCHPDRPHHAKGLCAKCYFTGVNSRRSTRTPTQGVFPIAPLLRYAGGADGPISVEELVYRTNGVVPLDGARRSLTEQEADHLAVALGRLPGDFWRGLWEDYDGPHYDDPQPDVFGPTVCQCRRCVVPVQMARAV